jgi:diaminopimelate epimerase
MWDRILVWKYHGLGNDFVIVAEALGGSLARALCDRRRGVGADGVLVVTEPTTTGEVAEITVWNSDGSLAEICGNGLRCVALHLRETLGLEGDSFVVGTGAGPKRCRIVEHPRPGVGEVEVEMGTATLDAAKIPFIGADERHEMIEAPLRIGSRDLEVTAVGMGNPHAVTFGDFSHDDVLTFGPLLERHRSFPRGVNAGFARVAAPHHLELTVWERGAGLTLACGSGACAAAVAACQTGRVAQGEPLEVRQPGGSLVITVSEALEVVMRGEARRVYSGIVETALLEG